MRIREREEKERNKEMGASGGRKRRERKEERDESERRKKEGSLKCEGDPIKGKSVERSHIFVSSFVSASQHFHSGFFSSFKVSSSSSYPKLLNWLEWEILMSTCLIVNTKQKERVRERKREKESE